MSGVTLSGVKGVHALERSGGSPLVGLCMILKQGLMVWYTAMVYNHGIQEVFK